MAGFDEILGYEWVKEELKQLCDMMHHFPIYESLGAKMPKGLLLHGRPGVGKTLMAKTLIEESGRKAFIIRRNQPGGDFINGIKNVFTKALENAPSIILLDDMDKFAVKERSREEYVTLQSYIDDLASNDVYIVATANTLRNIPKSLLRPGRFDRLIRIPPPKGEDAIEIIRHYMASKKFLGNMDIVDISKMLNGRTCAELEAIINHAAIYSAYKRRERVTMDDILQAVLRIEYGASDRHLSAQPDLLKEIAYHEAGHVVVSEFLDPESIGLVSLLSRRTRDMGGFVITCMEGRSNENRILTSLGGKASSELKFGIACKGSSSDLMTAMDIIGKDISNNGTYGIWALDTAGVLDHKSDFSKKNQEIIIRLKTEEYLYKAKEILIKDWDFLEALVGDLLKKKSLLYSDIQRIKTTLKYKHQSK